MVEFVDAHRGVHGVESICAHVPIAPSTYYEAKARERDPERLPDRAKSDAKQRIRIQETWDANYQVYGVVKVWRALNRGVVDQDDRVARCTVGRLMRGLGLRGVVRGKTFKTTTGDASTPRPADLVERNFAVARPNQLWVSDLTYVATWRNFAYVAFVIDAYSRRIVGWRVSDSLRSDLALDALEQAIYDRCPEQSDRLIHHSDRGVQYLSMRYTERLEEAGIAPSVGSRGDSYDNALAETVIGLYKTELIHRRGPWRTFEDVEFATLEWVAWYNTTRLFGPIGHLPPSEYEEGYYQTQKKTPTIPVGVN